MHIPFILIHQLLTFCYISPHLPSPPPHHHLSHLSHCYYYFYCSGIIWESVANVTPKHFDMYFQEQGNSLISPLIIIKFRKFNTIQYNYKYIVHNELSLIALVMSFIEIFYPDRDPILNHTLSYHVSLVFFSLEWLLAFVAFHDINSFEKHRSVAWYNVPQFEFDCFLMIKYQLNIFRRNTSLFLLSASYQEA